MATPFPIDNRDIRTIDAYHYVGKPLVCRWIDRLTYPLRMALGGREYHQRGPVRHAETKDRWRMAIFLVLLFPYTVSAMLLLLCKRVLPSPHFPQGRYPETPDSEERASYRAEIWKEGRKQ